MSARNQLTGLDRTIVALDNMDKASVFNFLSRAQGRLKFAKVGMELYYLLGRSLVEEIHQKFGVEIFLDLKLHDIPRTVGRAIGSLKNLPIRFLTVHLSGGQEMLDEARAAAADVLPQTQLLGVSHLTSLGPADFKELWNFGPIEVEQSFEKLTRLCLRTRIHGMVLSALELPLVGRFAQEFLRQNGEEATVTGPLIKVCPGIRFQDEIMSGQTQDQKRVAHPQMALKDGASFLVIGRSLVAAPNLEARLDELSKIIL